MAFTTDSGPYTRNTIYGALVSVIALGVIGVVLSPANVINILGFCGIAVTGLFAQLSTIAAAEKVREEVVTVKDTLKENTAKQDEKLEGIAQIGEKTHKLVNSGSLTELKLVAELSHWKADQTKLPKDIEAARSADRAVEEHIAKQQAADLEQAAKGK